MTQSETHAERRGSWRLKAVVFAAAVLLVVVAFEVALRAYHGVKDRRFRLDQPPLAERALIPSEDPELLFEWNPGFRNQRFSVNSHGMADEELEIEESPGVFRIAIVGDSVTAGFEKSRLRS